MSRLGLTLLVFVLIAAAVPVLGNGRLFTDEITGLTEKIVQIPKFSSEYLRTYQYTSGDLQATNPSGFKIATWGGIAFNADESVDIDLPSDFLVSASVTGNVDVVAQNVSLNGGDVNFASTHTNVFDATNMNFTTFLGDLTVDSDIHTRFEAADLLQVASVFRSLTISAPNGVTTLASNVISFSAGDPVDQESINLSSANNLDFNAGGVFDITTSDDLQIVGQRDVNLRSSDKTVDLRSFNTIAFSGGSNVDLRSENDFIIDSILNTVSVSATAEGAGYTGYHVLFDSDILTVSGSDAFFVTKGSVQFVDSNSNKLNFNTATFAADNANRFYTYHDLPITVSTLLNIKAPRVELRSSDHINIAPGNDVIFSTTKGTGDVHFQSPSFTFTGTGTSQTVSFTASAGSIDLLGESGFVDATGNVQRGTVKFTVNSLQSTSGLATVWTSPIITMTASTSASIDAGTNLGIFSGGLVELLGKNGVSISSSATFTTTSEGDVTFNAKNNDLTLSATDNIGFQAGYEFQADTVNQMTLNSAFNLGFTSPAATHINADISKSAPLTVTAGDNIQIRALEDKDDTISIDTFSTLKVTGKTSILEAGDQLDVYSLGGSFTVATPKSVQLTATDVSIISQQQVNSHATMTFNTNLNQLARDTSLVKTTVGGATMSASTSFFSTSEAATTINTSGFTVKSTAGNIHLVGEEGVFVTSTTDAVTITAEETFNVYGGGFTSSAITKADYTATNAISIHSENDSDFDFIAGNTITMNSNTWLRYHSANIQKASDTLTYHADTGALSFTTTGGDFTWESDTSSITLNAKGSAGVKVTTDNLQFWNPDDFTASLTAPKGSYTLTSGRTLNVLSGYDTTLNAQGSGSVTSLGQVVIDSLPGGAATFTQSSSTFVACDQANVRAVDDATFISTSGITFSKSWDPCGVKGTDPNAPYKITSLAVGTQTITAGTTATYTAPDIQILNGEIAFLARTGDINVNSSNAITFNSINDETAQYGPKSDTFDALKGTFKVDAAKAVHLTSTGVDLNESFRHFGIYLDTGVTTISDISYKAANGSFIATAAEDIFFGTSNPSTAPQNNHIKATQDITFTSAENFRVTSDGPINAGVYDPVFTNAGIQLETQTADMFISADKASLYLEGFRGITNKVTQGAATMKAGNSIFHSTARQNGNLLYNTPYGVITIDTGSDILLTAGTPTYDSAGVNTFASRDTNIISAGWQRYQHYGNSFLPNNIGIQLLADEGDITLTAGPNFNIEVDSSGHAAFTAQTGEINTIAQNDLILESDARVDFSSHQSALVQAINGFIDISAGGGGGHVLFQSDNNQDINVSAGKGVSIKAAANSRFEAVTGIVGKTNTGNIDFYNDGNDQDALFYSEGSILLQAKSATGAQFLARSLHAVAKNDFNIDAAAFTIGLTSLAVTNTEPIVSFGAGGDFDTDGLAIDSDGSVKLTTNKASSIAMVGDAFDLTAGQAISISANGNVLFSNSGILGDGSFIIETVAGVLTMNGQDDVIVSADTSNTLTTNGPFILQDNGVNAGNFVFMLSRRDFSLNAPNGKVAYTADTVEANLRDMTVDTVNNINFINPAGTGTLTFDSDRRLDITTLTGITLDAKSPSNIFTQGDLSHMTLRADNSDITASAGSNMFLQGTQIDIDGHNGLTVTSTLGSIALQSSAETRWAANKTINLEGRSLVTITAGDGTGDSTLIMKASGAFTANSTGDLRLTTQSNTDIVVIGDKRLTFRNLQAARAHDQGDITISANAGAVSTRTGGEVFYGVGGNLNVNTNKVMSTTAAGNISMKTTGAGANFLVQSKNDGIAIDGGANLHVYTQQSITYSSSTSFIGFAGVDTFAATLGNNALAFDKGALDIRATGAQADVVLTADIVNLLGSRGANITSASGAVVMSSTDVLITSNLGDTVLRADNADVNFIGGNSISSFAQSPNPDEPHVIFDAVAGGNSPNPAMSFTSQSIAISGATVNPNTHFTSNGNMVLSGAGAAMAFTANAGVLTVKATGQDPTAQYGIYMETDEINDFVSSGNLFLQALYGSVNSNAFEQTAIQASDIIARASDRLYIHSGFTQQPLALPPFRIAISVENTGNDVDLVTNSGDFIINADDVSFTATANMDLRASGPAGNINLDTESGSSIVATFATGLLRAHKGNAVMNQNTLTITASSSTAITAEGSILISSSGAGITFTANAGTIVHTVTESITLEAPVVDLRDTTGAVPTSIAANRLLMPLLRYEADVTGNQASRFWWIEDNYRGCVNRQFGFDDTSRSMCICSNNKWECTYGNGGVNSQAYLPVGPQINTPLTVLTQSGWVQCHNSQADQVAAIPATCGTNGVSSVFMGCLDTNTNLITVGAVGTFNSIFNVNPGGTYINANTFYRGAAAMGFKPAGDAFNTGGYSANNACDAAGGVDSQFRACFSIAGGNFNTFSSCGGVTAGANIRRVFFHNP